MRAELLPRLVNIVGDEAPRRRVTVRKQRRPEFTPPLAAGRLIGLRHSGHIPIRKETESVPAGASGSCDTPASPHKDWATWCYPPRRHHNAAAFIRNLFAAKKSAHQCDVLIGDPAPVTDTLAEVFQLLRPVPETDGVGHPPVADDVDDRHLLGQPNR